MLNRRAFVRAGAAATMAGTWGLSRTEYVVSAAPAVHTARRVLPTFKTALIGSGWWGRNILREAVASGRCKPVALADVDQNQLKPALSEAESYGMGRPKGYKDYLELLDREKPEIVIVATPDHWHPLATIDALKAGAHVYVEKPIGHTIHEGRAMVQTARATGKIVQVGTHRRVSPHNVSGMEFLKSGKLGKIGMVRAFVHYPGGPGTPIPDSDPPAGLDWDMWCGPAPLVPFNRAIHPKGFRQFLHFANGQLGDWGIHWMDQILWWTEELYPKSISSTGGRFIKVDNTDAPDTQVAQFQFDSFTAVWEHRLYGANNAEKTNIGCYFYGTEGTFHMGWLDGWTFYPNDSRKAVIHQDPMLNEPDAQNIKELWADFLDAIDHQRPPVCDIEIGHRSTNMSLLAMIALKLGRTLNWDGRTETFINDSEANALLERPYRAPYVYPKIDHV
jgi:predicted dehydrogenase